MILAAPAFTGLIRHDALVIDLQAGVADDASATFATTRARPEERAGIYRISGLDD
jgi:hypothetical protein